jgi:hypothetical protein
MTSHRASGRWKRRWRGALRLAALLAALAALLLAGAYATRGRWLHPWLVERVERQAAERFGAELAVGRLESGWLGGATLHDVTWRAPAPPLRALEAERLRVDWSLLDLVRGRDWLSSVEGEIALVELELELEPAPGSAEETRGGPSALPARLPAADVRIDRLSLALGGERAVELAGAELDITGRKALRAGQAFGLEVAAATWRERSRELQSPISLHGRYSGGRIELASSSVGELLELSEGELDLGRLEQGELSWSLAARALDGELHSTGKHGGARLDASFSARELDVARLEDVLGPFLPGSFPRELVPRLSTAGRLASGEPGEALAIELDWLEARTAGLLLRGAELSAALPGGDWREALRSARGRVLLEELEGVAPELAVPGGLVPGVPGDLPALDVALTVELDAGRAVLGGAISTAGGELAIERGELVFGPPESFFAGAQLDLDVHAGFDDFAPLAQALGLEGSGTLAGSIDVDGPLGALTGHLQAAARGVVIRGAAFDGIEVDAVARDGRFEVLDCELAGTGWSGTLTGAWIAAERRVEGVRAELTGGGTAIGPLAPRSFTLSLAADGAHSAPAGAFSLEVEDLGTRGFADLDLRLVGGFEGRTLRIESLLAEDRGLVLAGRGQVAFGEQGGFAVEADELELTGPGGAWRLAEAGAASFARGHLDLGPLSIESHSGGRVGSARVMAAVSGGSDPLEARFEDFEIAPLLALPAGVSGVATLSGELGGRWSALSGALVVSGRDLVTPGSEYLGGALEVELSIELGERVELERGVLRGPAGDLLTLRGALATPPDAARWIARPAELLEVPIELEASFALPLDGLARRLEDVRRISGTAEGQLTLGGTLARPRPSGRASVRASELRLEQLVVSIHELEAELELEPERVRIASMGLEFGGSPCTVRGEVALAAEGPVLDLELEGRNLLLARSATARLRADAKLALRGAPQAPEVSGLVVVTEGRFTKEINLLERLVPGSGSSRGPRTSGFRPVFARTGILSNATFDVRLQSARPIELEGNLYDVGLRPDLALGGTGAVPLFEGEVYAEPSTLSLPSGTLMINSGVLQFRREAPFDPHIVLSAELETKGYDIDAQIEGPLGSPEIVLSSNPPLPNDQLLLLFLTGQLQANEGLAAAQSVGIYLAKDAFVRWFGDGPSEGQSLLDNLVVEFGNEVSQTGASTWTGRYYLGSRRERTGRTFYLLAEQDVWDKTNFGVGLRVRFR